MFIGHMCFICGVPTDVFSVFLLICLFYLYQFLMWSEYRSCIGYVPGEFLLPMCGLYLHILYVVF